MTFPSEPRTARGASSPAAALAVLLLAALPAGGQETPGEETGALRVRQGDTLWGLAERHLGDASLWRALYRANADRLVDPHRLRPGMRLRIPGDPAPAAGDREEAAPPVRPDVGIRRGATPRPRPAESLFGRPEALPAAGLRLDSTAARSRVSPSEFARAPFLLAEGRWPDLLRTRGPLDGSRTPGALPVSLGDGERVLLDGGGGLPEAGEILQAFRRGSRVEGRGVVARPVALLRVEGHAAAGVVARVVRRFGLYRIGDPALPLRDPPSLDGGSYRSVEAGTTVRLLGSGLERPLVRPGSLLFVDAGRSRGIRPGDELVAPAGAAEDEAVRLRVIRADVESSTVRVVELTDPRLGPGARARLVRRLVGVEGG